MKPTPIVEQHVKKPVKIRIKKFFAHNNALKDASVMQATFAIRTENVSSRNNVQ
jgi:hypothetical protein